MMNKEELRAIINFEIEVYSTHVRTIKRESLLTFQVLDIAAYFKVEFQFVTNYKTIVAKDPQDGNETEITMGEHYFILNKKEPIINLYDRIIEALDCVIKNCPE